MGNAEGLKGKPKYMFEVHATNGKVSQGGQTTDDLRDTY